MVDTEEKPVVRAVVRETSSAAAGSAATRSTEHRPLGTASPQAARRWLERSAIWLMYVPAAAILLAGALAAVGLLGGVWRLERAVATHALASVPDTYDRLALAARVALVSAAFLVLLCALVVVAVGCRGRRWWRLYLIPGVPLSAAAALLFLFVAGWCAAALTEHFGWSAPLWEPLTALALADAVLVAARVGGIGAGPLGTRRALLRERQAALRVRRLSARQTQPLPIVRFGPRITPIFATDARPVAGATATIELQIADAPTADELRAAADPETVVSAPPASAHEAAQRASA